MKPDTLECAESAKKVLTRCFRIRPAHLLLSIVWKSLNYSYGTSKKVLKLLHEGHPGIVRTKMLDRRYVWWPSLGHDIEIFCDYCEICTMENFKPISNETLPWPATKFTFERVHIDFFQHMAQLYILFMRIHFLSGSMPRQYHQLPLMRLFYG